MQHPRANPDAPDFGVRVLGQEVLRRGEGVVSDDIRPTVNVDGHDFPAVGRLDLGTDVSLVDGIATPSGFLSRVTVGFSEYLVPERWPEV